MEGGLPDKVRKLYELFKDAIEGERGAQVLYKRALEIADDPEIKTALAKFIEDEARHEQELIDFYNRLRVRLGMEKDKG